MISVMRWLQGFTREPPAIALTKVTIGGQSVLYEQFRERYALPDSAIRKLEITYFAASITTAIYLRLGKQANREQILDAFTKHMDGQAVVSALGCDLAFASSGTFGCGFRRSRPWI
jgi:hypothetical protein